jgi:hypothetical protein
MLLGCPKASIFVNSLILLGPFTKDSPIGREKASNAKTPRFAKAARKTWGLGLLGFGEIVYYPAHAIFD